MGLIRIWNITDDVANPDVTPHNRMVLGKVVKPGRSIKVDEERLILAHKVKKEVAAGFLYIGNQPPSPYVQQKKPPKAVADARRVDEKGNFCGAEVDVAPGHGLVPAGQEPGVVFEITTDEVKVEEKVEVETMPAEPAEVENSRGFNSFGGRKKKSKKE